MFTTMALLLFSLLLNLYWTGFLDKERLYIFIGRCRATVCLSRDHVCLGI